MREVKRSDGWVNGCVGIGAVSKDGDGTVGVSLRQAVGGWSSVRLLAICSGRVISAVR